MKLNKMDIIVALCIVLGIVFTVVMIRLFMNFQSVPDSLVVAVFGALFGELGILGMIKKAKEKNEE